jgi:hypothetical protein
VRFNDAGADVDFHVEASGVADAFTIQGSDGQPRFGLLGIGFVQSDVNGDLSSAAIAGTDLPWSGVATRVAFWSAADTLTSDAGLTYIAGTDSLTAGNYFTVDGGEFGIDGGELLTVNAAGAGNFTFSDVGSVVVPNGAWVGADANASWVFDTTNSDVSTLDAVGIGRPNPISKLHIDEDNTNVGVTAGLTIEQDGDGDAIVQFLVTGSQRWVVGADNSDSDKFKIASTTDLDSDARLTIDTSGNIGIGGITSPTEVLVAGVDFGALGGTRISVGESGALSGLNIGEDADNRAFILWDDTGDYLFFGTRDGGVTFSDTLVLNDGDVGLGITLPEARLHLFEAGALSLIVETESDTQAPNFTSIRSNAGPAAVTDGRRLGAWRAFGYDGVGDIIGMRIAAEVDGTPGVNDMPTRIIFEVTADGAATVTEAMRIEQNRRVAIGTAGGAIGQLHVDNPSAAVPVLVLDQGDVSEEMIQFETTIGVGNAIEAVGAKTLTITHFIKITLPGAATRYIPCGTIA